VNAFKRAITNTKRQPVKNGVLLFLMIILATVLSGAISARHAINSTEESIMLQRPVLATLNLNVRAIVEETGVSQFELGREVFLSNRPTVADISAVGNLPYVRMYDAYMLPMLFSRDLEWAPLEIESDLESAEWSGSDGYLEWFEGRGVANPDVTDIDAGLIEMVVGRTFTQSEIDNGEHVAIIAQSFAEVNDLYVGATIEFESIVHDTPAMVREGLFSFAPYWHEERFMAAHQTLEFEIIGIFAVSNDLNYQDYDDWAMEEFGKLHNRFYIPISVAEDILVFENEGMRLIRDEMLEIFPYDAADWTNEEPWIQSTFVLYSPRDLDAFYEASSDLLPEFWEVNSLGDVNVGLITSMDAIRAIADFTLLFAAIATIAILTLIITLLLRDRRYEIGVYMALGEKKSRVIFQFLIETIIVSTVAITIALFIGHGVSAIISRNLLEQHLIDAEDSVRFGDGGLPFELMLFNPGEIPIEDALEMYDTSLDARTIFTFVSVGVAVILLSTIIPIVYVVKLEPKKVLLG